MLNRIKENKGYYGLLLGDTIKGSASWGVGIALINLPLAIMAVTLNVAAELAGGFAMGPKEAALPENITSAPQISLLKRGNIYAKGAWGVLKAGIKDPDFIVGSSAVGAGAGLFFQSLLGIHSILSSHSLLFLTALSPPVAAAGIAGCSVLAGVGLFTLFAGNIAKWKGLRKFYDNAFHKGSHSVSKKNATKNLFERLIERPGLKKIINSPITKRIKHSLLIVMAVESSLFSIAAASSIIGNHVFNLAAGPLTLATITGAAATAGLAIQMGAWPVWSLLSSAKLVARHLHKKKESAHEKEGITQNSIPVVQMAETNTIPASIRWLPDARALTGTFCKTSCKMLNGNQTKQTIKITDVRKLPLKNRS